jgi:L-lactate utilization protein LutC
MNFFKNIFNISSKEDEIKEQEVILSLDDSFVHYFKKKGGKFLYSTSINEVLENLGNILKENNWDELACIDTDLLSLLKKRNIKANKSLINEIPLFTSCEHLIADNGDIMFSSNQLNSNKLAALTSNFIVFATTSQLVKNTGEGLTGIKTNFKGNIPTNISAIKNYFIEENDDNFLNYGNSNSKNLYLLLFEDL